MLTNGDITLYHLDDKGAYQHTIYEGVSIYNKTKAVSAKNGIEYDNTCTIRIPTKKEMTVDTGDYVLLEKSYEPKPDKLRCRKVVGFYDNRRGSLQHWRLDCK